MRTWVLLCDGWTWSRQLCDSEVMMLQGLARAALHVRHAVWHQGNVCQQDLATGLCALLPQFWENLYHPVPAVVPEPVAAPYAVPVATPAVLEPTSGAVLVPEAPPSGAIVPAEPASGAVLPVTPAAPMAAVPAVTPPSGSNPGQALNPFAAPATTLTAGAPLSANAWESIQCRWQGEALNEPREDHNHSAHWQSAD